MFHILRAAPSEQRPDPKRAYEQLGEYQRLYAGLRVFPCLESNCPHACLGCGRCLSGGKVVGISKSIVNGKSSQNWVCLDCAKCAGCRRSFPIRTAYWMGEAPNAVGLYVGLCSDCYISPDGKKYPFE